MTRHRASQRLEAMLGTLDSLLPGFHAVDDRADLAEARAAIEAVEHRLAREIAAEAEVHP